MNLKFYLFHLIKSSILACVFLAGSHVPILSEFEFLFMASDFVEFWKCYTAKISELIKLLKLFWPN